MNREYINENMRKYYALHKDEINKRARDKYHINKIAKQPLTIDDKRKNINKHSINYYYRHKDEIREKRNKYSINYYYRNKDKISEKRKSKYKYIEREKEPYKCQYNVKPEILPYLDFN